MEPSQEMRELRHHQHLDQSLLRELRPSDGRRGERMSFNPRTIRLCRSCKEFTRFNYQPVFGHSGCMKCGQHFGLTAKAIIRILEERGFDINKAIQEENDE